MVGQILLNNNENATRIFFLKISDVNTAYIRVGAPGPLRTKACMRAANRSWVMRNNNFATYVIDENEIIIIIANTHAWTRVSARGIRKRNTNLPKRSCFLWASISASVDCSSSSRIDQAKHMCYSYF
jgi:hypothetical protein